MARTLTRNQQTYPAGTYGPFAVDGFTRDSAERLEATMTVVGWPNVSPLMVVEIAWDTGGKATFDVSGEQRDENGDLMPSVSFSFGIPRLAGVKRQVSGGTVKVTTFAPITTALQLRAV
jgi:hypothetical protein